MCKPTQKQQTDTDTRDLLCVPHSKFPSPTCQHGALGTNMALLRPAWSSRLLQGTAHPTDIFHHWWARSVVLMSLVVPLGCMETGANVSENERVPIVKMEQGFITPNCMRNICYRIDERCYWEMVQCYAYVYIQYINFKCACFKLFGNIHCTVHVLLWGNIILSFLIKFYLWHVITLTWPVFTIWNRLDIDGYI